MDVRLRDEVTVDRLLALVVGLACLPFLARSWEVRDLVPFVLMAGALAARRRPMVALGLAWAGAIAQMVAGLEIRPYDVTVIGVVHGAALYGSRAARRAGAASIVLGAITAAAYLMARRGLDRPWWGAQQLDYGATMALVIGTSLALSFTVGLLSRSAQARRDAEQAEAIAVMERELAQRAAVAEQERLKIARDIHDTVAHSLAVVIAQADGGRYAAARRPDSAVAALATIAALARDALGDVRLLLGQLREHDVAGPQPTAEDLPLLLDQFRAAGLRLDVHESGARIALGAGGEIALYRILQEALTNALRHGSAEHRVGCDIAWAEDQVRLAVANRLPVPQAGPGTALGHGVPGMRERAALAGGRLTAGPIADGSYRVEVVLPRHGPVVNSSIGIGA